MKLLLLMFRIMLYLLALLGGLQIIAVLLSARLNSHIEDVFSHTDRVIVTAGQHAYPKEGTIVLDINNADDIDNLSYCFFFRPSIIQVLSPGCLNDCEGDFLFELQGSDETLLKVEFHHGSAIKVKDHMRGYGLLRPGSSFSLGIWMVKHGLFTDGGVMIQADSAGQESLENDMESGEEGW